MDPNPLNETNRQQGLQDKLKRVPKLMIGKLAFDFDPANLNDEWQQRAVKELRETPETVDKGLRELRELLKNEPNLQVPTDTEFLNKFLRPVKWHADSAFELLKRFYKYKASHPRYCHDIRPNNERKAITSGVLTPLPKRTSEGVRVILIEGGKKWKPKEVSLDNMFRSVILLIEAAMAEPKSQVGGVRVIIDLEGMTLTHVTYFTPSFAGAVVDFVQRCMPIRLKGIHIVNQPFFFNMVFAFFKPFLQEKLRKRIHFHGTNWNDLMKYVDAKSLPSKYGGEIDFPNEPIGEPFATFLSTFEEDFIASSKYQWIGKA